ncbi:MAG: cupin domain-containing protein [Methylococcaceae bacterium]
MSAKIIKTNPQAEYYFDEGCYILELSNSNQDNAVSIARARVLAGVTTQWHSLHNTIERYVILSGSGLVEVGELTPQQVNAGDVVIIPAQCRQRISNTGNEDLIFLAICTPRFEVHHYQALN